MSQLQVLLFTLVLITLILLAAFFSLSETSLMAVNRYRLRHQARLKKSYAVNLLQLLKRPDRVLGAILIGNTFANMIASSLATLIAFHFWGDRGALLAAAVLTFIVLIFTEIIPKTIAAIFADKVARFVLYPTKFFLKILYPAVWLANIITNGFLKLLHINNSYSVEPLSREELRSVVHDARGKISRQYQHMLISILDLSKLCVEDVMIPYHEIIGINLDKPWEEILRILQQLDQETIPVYHGTINHLAGVLHVWDVLRLLLKQHKMTKEGLEKFIHEPYFVPEGTPLNVQMAYFQQSDEKVAFVVDEYGEILGLLTLTDILEEIVGDLAPSVAASKRIQLQADKSYLVEGAVTIREFNRFTEWELPVNGPRTVNGLVVEFLESLPHPGTAVLIAGHPIEIMQVKQNKVKLAKIYPKLPIAMPAG